MSRALHILVVDDDSTNLAVATSLLQQLGCTTASADDGIEAVRAAMAGGFQAVLMDCMMPRMDGYSATKAIRGHEARSRTSHMAIIGLSALASDEDRVRALAAGMDAYITKPVSKAALVAGLAACDLHPPEIEAVNPSIARQLRELPDALGASLWRKFAAELQPRCLDISAAARADDRELATFLVHSLRGSAATLGIDTLASKLSLCEILLKDGDPAWLAAWDEALAAVGPAQRAALAAATDS